MPRAMAIMVTSRCLVVSALSPKHAGADPLVGPLVVNLNARVNNFFAAEVRELAAGKWTVTPIGVADGGDYNAWQPGGIPGWSNVYGFASPPYPPFDIVPFTIIGNELTRYASDLDALANATASSFTLPTAANVALWLQDCDGCLGDNVGGMSLRLERVGVVLDDLSPADLWLGLKNSDDVGTRFDLRAEVFADGTLVSAGQIDNVSGGSSGFNNARRHAIPLPLASPAIVQSELSIAISARITCSGRTHTSGTARLWFNDAKADSGFDATLDGTNSDYFLLSGSALGSSPGPGPKNVVDKLLDSKAACPGRAFLPLGTWSVALP